MNDLKEGAQTCPLGSKCYEVKGDTVHRCAWSIKLAGKNPQTGENVDERGCAMAWVPLLLIENSQQQRSTGAAVESFRNEMVQANAAVLAAGLPMLARAAVGNHQMLEG